MPVLDDYGPFDSGVGASRIEGWWRSYFRHLTGSGVIAGELNEFVVAQRAAGANMSVDVATGRAYSASHWGESTTVKNVAVAAAHATLPRVDRVVIRADFVADTVGVEVVTGTAAAVPAIPPLTQNTVMWEIPLARIAVAAAAASIVTANITDERTFLTFGGREGAPLKRPVRAATTAALPANTASGAVLTASANGALPAQDGVTLVVGDRLLVKNEAAGANNGIFDVTDLGSASTPYRLTRASDMDTSAEAAPNTVVAVAEGSTLADTWWQVTTNAPIVLGTTALVFAQFGASSGSSVLGTVQDNSSQLGIASTLTTVASVEVTTGTGLVIVFGGFGGIQNSGTGTLTARIDSPSGTGIHSGVNDTRSAAERVTVNALAFHTPGAGTRTYYLRIATTAGTVDKDLGAWLVVMEA